MAKKRKPEFSEDDAPFFGEDAVTEADKLVLQAKLGQVETLGRLSGFCLSIRIPRGADGVFSKMAKDRCLRLIKETKHPDALIWAYRDLQDFLRQDQEVIATATEHLKKLMPQYLTTSESLDWGTLHMHLGMMFYYCREKGMREVFIEVVHERFPQITAKTFQVT